MATDGKRFVVVGWNGTIIQSGLIEPEPIEIKLRSQNGRLKLEWDSKSNSQYQIQSRPDWDHSNQWDSYGDPLTANDIITFHEVVTSESKQFFRVIKMD